MGNGILDVEVHESGGRGCRRLPILVADRELVATLQLIALSTWYDISLGVGGTNLETLSANAHSPEELKAKLLEALSKIILNDSQNIQDLNSSGRAEAHVVRVVRVLVQRVLALLVRPSFVVPGVVIVVLFFICARALGAAVPSCGKPCDMVRGR